jgi:hypothetical protein
MKRKDCVVSYPSKLKYKITLKDKNIFESIFSKKALDNESGVVHQVFPYDFFGKMMCQAIYYVANNKNRNARECLKKIGFSSFNAKGWVKEETLVQKRNPAEKNKYLNKIMPEEFQVYKN